MIWATFDSMLRIDVQVVHDEGVRWPCPECGELLTMYDHAPERVWRYLDTCQFKTYLHARIPRVNCPDLASIQEHAPGAEDKLVFDRLKCSPKTGQGNKVQNGLP
jgi:transposase